MTPNSKPDSVYITGLAHAYPPHSLTQEASEELINRLYPEHVTSPALQKLLYLNRKTGILSRPTILDYTQWTKVNSNPPSIDELSRIFMAAGVNLAASACTKAMEEARLSPTNITHIVAVTCTGQGNPGYDLFVSEKLGLSSNVQRVLLHGVGCAGGLSAVRTAADIASAASQRGRPARILVVACELCSLFLRAELQAACRDGEALHVAPALFSDAAAAVVVCNKIALGERHEPLLELLEWSSMVVPGTTGMMSYDIEENGMIASITKDVPKTAVSAITPMFDRLSHMRGTARNPASHFDWAIHPGGAAILQGAKEALHLTDDHIRASLDVYRHFGNSSSPTVLIVLDKMRRMGEGRDKVIATSFGPGLMIEMCMMRRCRSVETKPLVGSLHGRTYASWLSWQSRLVRKIVGHQRGKMDGVGRTSGRWHSVVR